MAGGGTCSDGRARVQVWSQHGSAVWPTSRMQYARPCSRRPPSLCSHPLHSAHLMTSTATPSSPSPSIAARMGRPAVPPGSPSSLLLYCCPTCGGGGVRTSTASAGQPPRQGQPPRRCAAAGGCSSARPPRPRLPGTPSSCGWPRGRAPMQSAPWLPQPRSRARRGWQTGSSSPPLRRSAAPRASQSRCSEGGAEGNARGVGAYMARVSPSGYPRRAGSPSSGQAHPGGGAATASLPLAPAARAATQRLCLTARLTAHRIASECCDSMRASAGGRARRWRSSATKWRREAAVATMAGAQRLIDPSSRCKWACKPEWRLQALHGNAVHGSLGPEGASRAPAHRYLCNCVTVAS